MTMTAQEVRALRNERGWTQRQMAALCGVTKRTVRRWERFGATETASKLLAILGGAHVEA